MRTIFHERLKRVMKDRKVTQTELAKRLDVKQSSVWQWLNTEYPSIDRLIEICCTLKVSPAYLLGFEEEQ